MSKPRVRNLALCIFHHEGKIFVNGFEDPVKQHTFFCLLVPEGLQARLTLLSLLR